MKFDSLPVAGYTLIVYVGMLRYRECGCKSGAIEFEKSLRWDLAEELLWRHKKGRKRDPRRHEILQAQNRLRKSSIEGTNSAKQQPAGAEAHLILLALLARLKSCPCYKAHTESFSAACKARPRFEKRLPHDLSLALFHGSIRKSFPQAVKSCPDYNARFGGVFAGFETLAFEKSSNAVALGAREKGSGESDAARVSFGAAGGRGCGGG